MRAASGAYYFFAEVRLQKKPHCPSCRLMEVPISGLMEVPISGLFRISKQFQKVFSPKFPPWGFSCVGGKPHDNALGRQSRRRLDPLVALGDDLLVEDAYLFDHEQPHVLNEIARQLLI